MGEVTAEEVKAVAAADHHHIHWVEELPAGSPLGPRSPQRGPSAARMGAVSLPTGNKYNKYPSSRIIDIPEIGQRNMRPVFPSHDTAKGFKVGVFMHQNGVSS